MNIEQTGDILGAMAVLDQRNVSEMDVLAWHGIIGHLDFAACLDAVQAFYAEHSDRRAMPADIRKLATSIQNRRREAAERQQRQKQIGAGTTRDRSPQVAALVQQVAASLPKPSLHDKARERARAERGRPPAELTRARQQGRPTKRASEPPPATGEVAALAQHYLIEGWEPADVAERLGISRKWCYRVASRLGADPEAVAKKHARELRQRIQNEEAA